MLLLTGSDRRHALTLSAVDRLQAHVHLERAETVVDALLRSARRPPALLLLDIAVDDAFAPVVVRHLARVAPQTEVMLFDERTRSVPGHPTVLAWGDLEVRLQHWWQCRQTLAGPDASNAANDDPT